MSIARALEELNVVGWSLDGEPSNESEFNASFKKNVGVDDEGTAIKSSDPADFGVTWAEVKAKYDEIVAAKPMRLLRVERNQRLANTDWWASSDLTMTAEQTAYRQALRDITETYNSLDTVVWPEKPNV